MLFFFFFLFTTKKLEREEKFLYLKRKEMFAVSGSAQRSFLDIPGRGTAAWKEEFCFLQSHSLCGNPTGFETKMDTL